MVQEKQTVISSTGLLANDICMCAVLIIFLLAGHALALVVKFAGH